MKTVKVQQNNAADFIAYCRKYGGEHDDSYTGPDDLNEETLNSPDDPSYVLLDDEGAIIGAVSLVLANFKNVGKGRMRIFHCIRPIEAHYRLLYNEISKHTAGIKDIYLFLPEAKTAEAAILMKLGFAEWRRSYMMTRKAEAAIKAEFPEGYRLEELVRDRDEETWCSVINASFAHLAGHTDVTPDFARELLKSEGFLQGGLKILWRGDEAAGTVQTVREDGECAYIEKVAVLPGYQRQGLGRQLLRAGMAKAYEAGFQTVNLFVNAENEKALKLYLDEGFTVCKCMVCWNKNIKN